MRLVRFGPAQLERPAVLLAPGRCVDVTDEVGDFDSEFFESGGLQRLEALLADPHHMQSVDLSSVRIGAPIARPPSLICVGVNYRGHARESASAIPEEPVIFNKAPNTVVGPNDDVLIPVGGTKTDWEVELALVIGRRARYLSDTDSALEHVAGYAISNDVSERGFQLERGGQWVKGKSSETFNPLGPWLATPDEIPNPQALDLQLRVNGKVVQQASTSDMIFSVAYIVWYLSQFMVLEPGDLINTGTPAGVGLGMNPPRYLVEGDVMEASIESLGKQRQLVRQGIP